MCSFSARLWTALRFYIAVALTCISGCAKDVVGEPASADSATYLDHEKVASAHRLLGEADLAKFDTGKTSTEILKEIQWRGNFEMASKHNGKSVAAISYELFAADPKQNDGEVVWAIFVDEKFVKFVEWPEWEMETVYIDGTPASRPKPIKPGSFKRLIRAFESESINIPDLKKKALARTAPRTRTDLGLTMAWLLLRNDLGKASKEDYAQNAKLRDRFNASRIKLGMTELEVEAIFGQGPVDSGETGSNTCKVYGSNRSFHIGHSLHFANVLVLYQNGAVSGIYSGEMVPVVREVLMKAISIDAPLK